MFEFIFDGITFFVGLVCAIQSGYLIWYFATIKKQARLKSALSWMLAGEFTTGIGTLLFSALALADVLSGIPGWIQNSIRCVMFLALGISSWHLRFQIRKIEEEDA